jgi:Peptidase family M28/PA domain
MKRTLPLVFLAGALVAAEPGNIAEKYRDPADKLIAAALADEEGLHRLQYLTDRIGNRLSGSASLERAIVWAASEMKKAGLENVQTPPVKVPHWVRGKESAIMLAPVDKPLTMIGLGMSVGTPKDGITADVVAVNDFDQLTALGREKVAGKIVLYNPEWKGYGPTVVYRTSGASRAAALGAVAVLVRSMTGHSLQTPHTGAMNYTDGVAKIPAAALSVEDAAMIERLVRAGTPVKVRLMMEAHQGADADSHNVMGEIRGREKPEEVVVLGGHIDSWDIGQGANDDGSGIMATLQAVALIKKLGLQPRRTIRVCFWVNEENGGAGGVAYRAMVGDAVKNHVAAIEMDGGAEKPLGFGFGGGLEERAGGRRRAPVAPTSPGAFRRVVEIGKLLEGIEGGAISPGGGGSDISPLMADGVPGLGVRTVGEHYFDWHHTDADSFDKLVPREFQLNVAALAVMSYVLADMPERIGDL